MLVGGLCPLGGGLRLFVFRVVTLLGDYARSGFRVVKAAAVSPKSYNITTVLTTVKRPLTSIGVKVDEVNEDLHSSLWVSSIRRCPKTRLSFHDAICRPILRERRESAAVRF
jgi:hypothetical protein